MSEMREEAGFTKSVYEQPAHWGMQCQCDGTGDHLGPDHLLSLQVVGGCDVGSKTPHPWQSPPRHQEGKFTFMYTHDSTTAGGKHAGA